MRLGIPIKRKRPGLSPRPFRTTLTLHSHLTGGGDIQVSDSRCRARLTERNLEPIDVALTFTGLAAEMREVAR